MRRLGAIFINLLLSGGVAFAFSSSSNNVVVCVDGGGSTVPPCPSGSVPAIVSGYVLSSSDFALISDATSSFDPVLGSQYFAFGFGVVILTWVSAFGIGQVLRLLRES